MAELLKGAPAAAALVEKNKAAAAALREKNIIPTLAILRVGDREDDLSYERGAAKRCEACDVALKRVVLPADISQDELLRQLELLNNDPSIHGILPLRPFPAQIDDTEFRRAMAPQKDVDGITDASLSGVFTDTDIGFAPCTAQAVIHILQHYNIPIAGRHAVIAGRSLVIGRPAAMLLMQEGATVTICHSKTADMAAITKTADIVVAAIGHRQFFTGNYFSAGQTIVDVGIHFNPDTQKMCGDVITDEAAEIVDAITPVPGGVGAVTTAVLVSHVIAAAERTLN